MLEKLQEWRMDNTRMERERTDSGSSTKKDARIEEKGTFKNNGLITGVSYSYWSKRKKYLTQHTCRLRTQLSITEVCV